MWNNNNPWKDFNDNSKKNSGGEKNGNNKSGFFDFNKIFSDGFEKKYIFLVALIVLIFWLSTGFYVVQPNQEGVELRFGRYSITTTPGLHYHLPMPIENVFLVDVTTVNHEEIGYRSGSRSDSLFSAESLMLTGDENIIDINFEIQWRISNARDYLFNLFDKKLGLTVQAAAESAMREVVGKNKIGYIIEGIGRAAISQETREILQNTLNGYSMGVEVISVQMRKADPPARVIDAFRDVQTARADKERTINQAYAYKNEIIPRVRGEAEQIINESQAYGYRVINQSIGETERFLKIYEQYKDNKFITKKRMYLETIEEVLSGKEKLLLTNKNNIVPFLSATEALKNGGIAK